MQITGKVSNRLLSNTLWFTLAGGSVFATGYALLSLRRMSSSSLLALGIAIVVAILIARHEIRIYGTAFRVITKDIFAFWGIVWLGVAGGVWIGLAGSIAAVYSKNLERKRWWLPISSDVISAFVIGSIYQLAFGNFRAQFVPAEHLEMMIAASVLMAAAHFVFRSTLLYVGRRLVDDVKSRELLTETFLLPAVSYLITIAATLTLNFTFLQFGLEFGLVVLPIAVIGSVAYHIHRQLLANKTREITSASRIHLATVEALATAIDARDQMGIGHVRRTQILAVGIGKVLELTEAEMSALRTGALLHDIGKLAVPDHILNKTSELTEAEIEKTKIHASVGASILQNVGFETPVVPTVKYHHENWDGSGYPEALRGENIPLTARILAVADAYDTLRGSRPYRPAVTREEAVELLRADAGKKFDPRLIQVFFDHLHTFEAEIGRQGLGYHRDRGDGRLQKVSVRTGSQTYVDQITLANREAFTLYELAKEFSGSIHLQETLSLFTDKVREFVRFDTCAVYLLDENSDAASCSFAAGKHTAVFNNHRIVKGRGITGEVLSTLTIARNCDPWPDLQLLRSSLTTDFRWMISLPLISDDGLIGAVSLYTTDALGYSDEHVRLVETIGKMAADAIAKSQKHAEAESHALTDPMTGLPNARALQLQFERETARAHRAGSTFQILMLDLDGFKQVNDTFGHKAGDRMLLEIGRVIRAQLREYDFLARYAGDEFVAIIPETSAEAIFELSNRIETAVGQFSLQIGSSAASVGVSIGSATYPYSGKKFDELLIAADKAMYFAKAQRKQAHAANRMIPKPSESLEPESTIRVEPHEIDAIVDIDEEHILVSPLS